MLLPGDIGREVEGRVADALDRATFRIVKVPHHGSAGSSTPMLVETIFEAVLAIRKEGVPVLLVEQNAFMALQIADRGYVMETGEIVLEGAGRELLENDEIKRAYLG